VDEVANGLSLADGSDKGLGPGQRLAHIRPTLVPHLDDLPRGLDQPTVKAIALDDLGVVLGTQGSGEIGH
jgi:hypothetical protein